MARRHSSDNQKPKVENRHKAFILKQNKNPQVIGKVTKLIPRSLPPKKKNRWWDNNNKNSVCLIVWVFFVSPYLLSYTLEQQNNDFIKSDILYARISMRWTLYYLLIQDCTPVTTWKRGSSSDKVVLSFIECLSS